MIESARRILFSPTRAAFIEVRLGMPSRGQLGRAILFAAGAGLCNGVLGASVDLLLGHGSVVDIVELGLFTGIRFVVALLVTQGSLFGLARLAGAHGDFDRQMYAGALFNVPLTFVGVLLWALNGLEPGLGYALALMPLLYQILLTVPMMRALYDDWFPPNGGLVLISIAANAAGGFVGAVLPQ